MPHQVKLLSMKDYHHFLRRLERNRKPPHMKPVPDKRKDLPIPPKAEIIQFRLNTWEEKLINDHQKTKTNVIATEWALVLLSSRTMEQQENISISM